MVLSGRSRATLLLTVFLACVSFAIVMPSLWPYLEGLGASKRFLALVVSFYSVGEGVGAVVFGALAARRRTRAVMLEATLIGGVGSALYATAPLWRDPRLGAGAVFLARFAQGVWTGGAQAAQQTHLAKTLPVELLTATTVAINAYACFGFVMGPSFALIFEALPPFCLAGTKLCVNQLTAPGYFVFASAIATIFLFAYCFDDDDDDALTLAATGSIDTHNGHTNGKQASLMSENDHHNSEMSPLLHEQVRCLRDEGNLSFAIFVCNFCFFTHFYGFALQETITTYVNHYVPNGTCHNAIANQLSLVYAIRMLAGRSYKLITGGASTLPISCSLARAPAPYLFFLWWGV